MLMSLKTSIQRMQEKSILKCMHASYACPLSAGSATPPSNATYAFDYSRSPFSFTVTRAGNTADPPLFTTKGSRLVFKVQCSGVISAPKPRMVADVQFVFSDATEPLIF